MRIHRQSSAFPRVVLLVALALLPAAASGQTPCTTGPSSDAQHSVSWVEPQPVDVARKEIVAALEGLGYRVAAVPGGLTAGPKTTWPKDEVLRPWRVLTYPGAELGVAIEPAGPWTRVGLTTRLVCQTSQRAPRGYPIDVVFDSFVLDGTAREVESAVAHALERIKVSELAPSCAPLRPGKRAVETCRLIARKHPDDVDAQLQHAIQLVRAHRAEEAWDPMRRVFALEGERAPAFLALGDAMIAAGEFDAAARLYERGIELWPRDGRMAFRFGRATLELGHAEQALPSLLAASALDPTAAEGHWYAAAVLGQLGRMNESRVHCEFAAAPLSTMVQQNPKDVEGWLGLAYCAHALGRHEKALQAYEHALDADLERAQSAPYVVAAVRKSLTMVGSQEPAIER